MEQFKNLQILLKQLNQEVNITRLIEGNDYWVSQILDSLWAIKAELKTTPKPKRIIDVGSGCGLPGLAIAIALPNSSITLVDSVSRKTNALKKITNFLGIQSRVNIRTERIELTGHNKLFRGSFDIAVARAVAKAPVVAEYLVPLLKSDGKALIYKGKLNSTDIKELKKALSFLKAQINSLDKILLPDNRGIRHLITLGIISKCPSVYPRSIGVPTKRPLNTTQK